MTDLPAAAARSADAAGRWICPFCPLLCEQLAVAADPVRLAGGDCPRAAARLARQFDGVAGPMVDGRPASPAEAVTAAAAILRRSRQPLFGGLGTDVSGARALFRLASATGAIADSAQGPALIEGLRALQDRGGFTTTLAELRTRADLVLCLGGVFADAAPLFLDRCLLPPRSAGLAGDPPPRQVVVLGASPADAAALARLASAPGIALQQVSLQGDLHDTVALLAALVAGRAVPAAPPALRALAQALRAARYGVIVGAPGGLPAQGALLIEAVHRLVDTINDDTRAAALWLGGGEGAATTNQVFTWLSGLPLRSRNGPAGLEHQPVAFDARRMLDDGAVDSLLWVSSFDASLLPPATALPCVVLGPPALGAAWPAASAGGPTVFIPVATPGIDIAGDLFRTDGTVLLPLLPLPPGTARGLPALAAVLAEIEAALATEATA
ncbi:MAG: formylmethanofuran dehydrogenase [Burkholderiaceae bacterium]|nr:formylmethanofuran dehydrogenase [Burkholderiaceae bacterium]